MNIVKYTDLIQERGQTRASAVIQVGSNFGSSSDCLMYLKRKEGAVRVILNGSSERPVLSSSFFVVHRLFFSLTMPRTVEFLQFLNRVPKAYEAVRNTAKLDWQSCNRPVRDCKKWILRFEPKYGQRRGNSIIQIRCNLVSYSKPSKSDDIVARESLVYYSILTFCQFHIF